MCVRIIILGVSGNGLEILETLKAINAMNGTEVYRCVGILDDAAQRWGTVFEGVEVLGSLESATGYGECRFVSAIGSPRSFRQRSAIIERVGIPLSRFETIIHPSAVVSPSAELGRGTVLLQNVTVGARAMIGEHVIVLPASVVSHHDVVGSYTTIASGVCIAGEVRVGESCYLGSNSSIKEMLTIGDRCLVGMGSVVLHDVASESVVVGVPARLIGGTPVG